MSPIPVLAVGPILLVSIQVDLNDRVAAELQQAVLERIRATGTSGLLIDITAVPVVDTYIARVLTETASMARVMDTRVVLVGMQPEVAITLLEMGLEQHRCGAPRARPLLASTSRPAFCATRIS